MESPPSRFLCIARGFAYCNSISLYTGWKKRIYFWTDEAVSESHVGRFYIYFFVLKDGGKLTQDEDMKST